MFNKCASVAALASIVLALGTQGAAKADGYISASGVQSLNNQLVTVKVSAYQSGAYLSGSVNITSNQYYFGGLDAAINWSKVGISPNLKDHVVITTAPFTFYAWQGTLLTRTVAFGVITMTGSGAGATASFQVVRSSDHAVLVGSPTELPFVQGSIMMLKW